MRRDARRALVPLALACALAYACWREDDRSPAGVYVHPAAFAVGAGQALESPLRLAAGGGLVLVTDALLDMVMFIDPVTLQSFEAFPVVGKPLSVGVLGKHVLVGNETEASLEFYDQRGRLKHSTGKGSVGRPSDIAVDDGLGLAFVLDAGARNVKAYDERGRLVATLSGPGLAQDQLTAPVGIAVQPSTRRIFVSDWGDYGNANGGTASVKVFDYDGAFVDIISGRGSCGMLGCTGGFSRPQGLQLDGTGRVYLADAILAQVLVIDPVLKKVTAYLGGRPMLRLPTDVVLVGGDVFVASNRTASVEVVRGGVRP